VKKDYPLGGDGACPEHHGLFDPRNFQKTAAVGQLVTVIGVADVVVTVWVTIEVEVGVVKIVVVVVAALGVMVLQDG
jgi:hypothetical protein